MQPTFILSCESTIDLPYSYVQERELPVLFYSYSVDGEAHVDDMGRDPPVAAPLLSVHRGRQAAVDLAAQRGAV